MMLIGIVGISVFILVGGMALFLETEEANRKEELKMSKIRTIEEIDEDLKKLNAEKEEFHEKNCQYEQGEHCEIILDDGDKKLMYFSHARNGQYYFVNFLSDIEGPSVANAYDTHRSLGVNGTKVTIQMEGEDK